MREIYYSEVPAWLRLLTCWGIQGKSYRFKWGEFVPDFGFSIKYSVYHDEGTVVFNLLWGRFYFKTPMVIHQRENTEDWNAEYGISYHDRGLWWHWRTKFWVFRMPWEWEHVRHTILNLDGSINCDADSLKHSWEPPESTKETHNYTYTLKSGVVQARKATIYGEEREWRWRWFQWLRWPNISRRSISIDFDAEVGERTGSWKGGTVGCGYDWNQGESQIECLRRMELEREFK